MEIILSFLFTDGRDRTGHGRIEIVIALDLLLASSSVVGLFHEITTADVVAASIRFVHHFLFCERR